MGQAVTGTGLVHQKLPRQNHKNGGNSDQGTDGACSIYFFMFKHEPSIARRGGKQSLIAAEGNRYEAPGGSERCEWPTIARKKKARRSKCRAGLEGRDTLDATY